MYWDVLRTTAGFLGGTYIKPNCRQALVVAKVFAPHLRTLSDSNGTGNLFVLVGWNFIDKGCTSGKEAEKLMSELRSQLPLYTKAHIVMKAFYT